MWRFSTDNQLWSEAKVFLAALASATCMTTMEKSKLAALYAKFASSAAFVMSSAYTQLGWTGLDSLTYVSAVQKLFTRKQGSND